MTLTADTRVLVTGASGRLGWRLALALAPKARCLRTGFRNAPPDSGEWTRVDLLRPTETQHLLAKNRPDIVIHCAALTDVDLCETDPASAFRLNVEATRNLTDWIVDQAPMTLFAYVSTDQLYDGTGPHAETEAAPVNIYGMTKYWGEDLARRVPQSLVLRTNFFGLSGPERPSFADWLVGGLVDRRPLALFDDVLFNPLHVDDLCETIIALIEARARGTYNVGATGPGLSKAEFGMRVAKALSLDNSKIELTSLSTAKLVARRPNDMRMSVAVAERTLSRQMPTVDQGIERLRSEYHTAPASRAREAS